MLKKYNITLGNFVFEYFSSILFGGGACSLQTTYM